MSLKGALANLLCILAWTSPLFCLPASVVLITYSHGVLAVVVGFLLMALLLGGPMDWKFRVSMYLVMLTIAIAAGTVWAAAGAGQ